MGATHRRLRATADCRTQTRSSRSGLTISPFGKWQTSGDLDGRTRMLAILAALAGSQGTDEFCALLPAALEMGVRPVEVKELLYQAVAYLGIGRVLPFCGR